MIEKLMPLHKDILMQELDHNDFSKSPIITIRKQQDDKNEFRFYKIMAIGPEVTEVSIGETIIVSWVSTMPSFRWHEDKVTMTREKDIIAVVDK